MTNKAQDKAIDLHVKKASIFVNRLKAHKTKKARLQAGQSPGENNTDFYQNCLIKFQASTGIQRSVWPASCCEAPSNAHQRTV